MDILYILGGGSKRDNIELRWSLRSIEKFGANIGRIAVAGVIPDWVSDEIISIPVEQKSPLYAKNNFHNVMEAVRSGELDDKFLLSADDHFYVKPVDFDDFPLFVAGFLPDRLDICRTTSISSACIIHGSCLNAPDSHSTTARSTTTFP